jgi:hypothetical protein
VRRRCRLRGSPALLSGRLFDAAGNRMSPSHTNKGGVRYRYYVSQAVLRKKPHAPGAVSRVPAAELEALVIATLRKHLQASSGTQEAVSANNQEHQAARDDRDSLERHVDRVTFTPTRVQLRLREIGAGPAEADADPDGTASGRLGIATISIAWTGPLPPAVKGIVHVPAHNTPISPSRREALLIAIAKARRWVDDLSNGRAASFAAIARQEGKVERHIRLLVPLAFLSPRLVATLLDGSAPAGLTITALARALPHSWAGQERRLLRHLSGAAQGADEAPGQPS